LIFTVVKLLCSYICTFTQKPNYTTEINSIADSWYLNG